MFYGFVASLAIQVMMTILNSSPSWPIELGDKIFQMLARSKLDVD